MTDCILRYEDHHTGIKQVLMLSKSGKYLRKTVVNLNSTNKIFIPLLKVYLFSNRHVFKIGLC